jgi:hypothetical protein
MTSMRLEDAPFLRHQQGTFGHHNWPFNRPSSFSVQPERASSQSTISGCRFLRLLRPIELKIATNLGGNLCKRRVIEIEFVS